MRLATGLDKVLMRRPANFARLWYEEVWRCMKDEKSTIVDFQHMTDDAKSKQ